MDQREQTCLPYKYDAMCKTDLLESDKFTFVWRISKFSLRTEKNGEAMYSDDFTIKGPREKITKWHVELYPRGKIGDALEYVSVFLQNKTAVEVVANCVVSTLDANKVKQKIFENLTKFRRQGIMGSNKALSRNKIVKHTPDDILTLFVEVTVLGEESTNSSEHSQDLNQNGVLSPQYHQNQLVQDLDSALLSKNHSDVTVECDGKEFHCHQVILTTRSPVFQTMLESSKKEKEKRTVEVNDMNFEVLEDLLKYIYTGHAPNVDDHVEELFAAAERYQLDKLKELCEVKLCSRLEITNCVDLLILGNLHNGQILKTAALEYVSKSIHKNNTCDWKETLIAHPDLMAEVMLTILPNNAPTDMNESISSGTDQFIENTKSSVTSYFSAVTDYATSFSVAKVALKAVDSSLELVDGVIKKSDENE